MLLRSTNKLRLFFTLVAIICIVIMFLLGFWQLDRKAQKEARLAQIESRQDASALSIDEIIDSPEDYVDFPLMLTAELGNQTFFIDNKLNNAVAGYEVLVPVQTNYGVLLVNLGWVPGTPERRQLPKVIIPTANQHIGNVYIPSDNMLIKETNFNYGRFPVRMQQIDFAEMEKHLGKDVLPFTLRLQPDKSGHFVRDWQVVVLPPERHLGYAVQWFGLGIAGLTVFLLTIINNKKRA
ncbi:SURF1 family protein [Ningiella sp. W23]|uniref:SURF1 family protein n=1 Tax=Ningiella sp. W23 TaxID=3023715 RepID=UPI0037571031